MITHDAGLADELPRQNRMLDGQVISDTSRDRSVLVAPVDAAGGEATDALSTKSGRLRLSDGLRVASVGLRARPLRAALSALGIAIGTAAIVGILGLSSSSQAGLLAEIDRLGTNMLTVEGDSAHGIPDAAGRSLTGGAAQLPREARARITHLDNVQQVTDTALIKEARVYR